MRRTSVSPAVTARLLAALVMQSTIATAGTPFFLDPQTTHTNGMPKATSEPMRDADNLRACSRDHIGCCGGRYNSPFANSMFHPNRCEDYRKPWPLDDRTPGVTLETQPITPFGNGIETEQVVRLGSAPNVQPAAGAANASSPANGNPVAGLSALLGQ